MGVTLLVKYEKFCIDFFAFCDILPVLWHSLQQHMLGQAQYRAASSTKKTFPDPEQNFFQCWT